MAEERCQIHPDPEHERLTERVGRWKVECSFFMEPGAEPFHSEAVEEVEMLGPFWCVSHFEADLMGSPFRGLATLGYEPGARQWVSTWIDSMGPHLYTFSGPGDAHGQALTLTGEGPDPQSGKVTTFRTVETRVSKDERHFDMYMRRATGIEHQLLHYVYKRA